MTVRVLRTIELTSAPSQLWPIVSDTERTNRLLGQPEVRYTASSTSSLARFSAESTLGLGLRLRYEELPFEWEEPRRYRIRRVMQGTPAREYTLQVRLTPHGDGTQLELDLQIEPRHWLGRALAWVIGRAFASGFLRFARDTDRFLQQQAKTPPALGAGVAGHPFAQPRSPTDDDELARRSAALERALKKTGGAHRDGAQQVLLDFLRDGADSELSKMRPFELAARWQMPPREALALCMHGVRAGLLELRFAVVCPSCQLPNDTVGALGELGERDHCALCDLNYELDLDRAVEVIFVVHPALRKLADQVFCLAGPGRSPHVIEQRHLPAGARVEFQGPERPGRYRLFLRGGLTASLEVSPEAPAEPAALTFDGERLEPQVLRLAPQTPLVLENRGTIDLHGKLERLEYASLAATVHEVSVIPEFRQLCSRDLLKSSTPLRIANVVLLFSDLTGSTQMYSELGDAAAFRVVDDHFDVLRQVIERHQGTLIKTMGDAVMASFLDTKAALAAAADALADFERWQRDTPAAAHIGLKLGVHSGPCYVITANDTLDYFGQTVNVAARLQGLARSAECTMTAELFEAQSPAASARLAVRARADATLKGVTAPVSVVHLSLANTPAP